jgi:hypothetical protein
MDFLRRGDATLDRIVYYNAYRLELDGPSMGKLKVSEEIEPSVQSAATVALSSVRDSC